MLLWLWLHKDLFALLDKYPEMELLDHMGVLCLIFWGISILFSIVAPPLYIPISNAQVFQCLHILANSCYFLGSLAGRSNYFTEGLQGWVQGLGGQWDPMSLAQLGSPWFHIPCKCVCVCVCFSNSRANVCKVVSQCGVDFIPLVISGVEHLFLCLSAFV